MPVKLWLGILLVPLLLLSCGGGNSDESQIKDVLHGYIDAYVDSRPADMYALLDSESKANCSEDNYTEFIKRVREALGDTEFEVLEVSEITIDADTATAVTHTRIGDELAEPTENTLVKEDGVWKLKLPSPSC